MWGSIHGWTMFLEQAYSLQTQQLFAGPPTKDLSTDFACRKGFTYSWTWRDQDGHDILSLAYTTSIFYPDGQHTHAFSVKRGLPVGGNVAIWHLSAMLACIALTVDWLILFAVAWLAGSMNHALSLVRASTNDAAHQLKKFHNPILTNRMLSSNKECFQGIQFICGPLNVCE